MKKISVIGLVLVITFSFILAGSIDVYAMNNESAAMLAGAIAIFGKPILRAIVSEVSYQPVYSISYETPRYYYRSSCYRPRSAYKRGWCEEQSRIERERERLEYQRGRIDARKYFYRY